MAFLYDKFFCWFDMTFIRNFLGIALVIGGTLFGPRLAKADGYVPCSFNYEIRACKLDYLADGLKITWRDGKQMKYLGTPSNNTFLRDSLGGSWRYLDFDTGKAFSLTNPSNGNVIIWNGTYKMYGRYVGL